ncbi:MAG: hypothetical protein WKF59_15485 [Chitinophagaceae bacterium]
MLKCCTAITLDRKDADSTITEEALAIIDGDEIINKKKINSCYLNPIGIKVL